MVKRARQRLAAGEQQARRGIGVQQIPAEREQIFNGRGFRGRHSCGIRQYTFQIVHDDERGHVSQGALDRLHRPFQVGILRHRVVLTLRQQLLSQAVQNGAHVLVCIHTDESRLPESPGAHQPSCQFRGQRGFARAALTAHHSVLLVT